MCSKCGGYNIIKRGHQDGIQIYECKICKIRFRNKRRKKFKLEKHIWFDFVFKKQTIRELREFYNLDRRIIHKCLEEYTLPQKAHTPRALFVVVDATYFRKEKNTNPWCAVVFRDPLKKENLWFGFGDVETHNLYFEGRKYLENLGYTILGVTGDGISCIRKVFNDIPFQMCLVHMERIVVRKITNNPKTEAGIVFLSLIRTLKDTSANLFVERFDKYVDMFRTFLNEKTINPLTGRQEWSHRELHSAVLSTKVFLPYLFTYKYTHGLTPNTNSLEGHFSHIKDIIRIHRGISKPLLQKILSSIFIESTIAPKNMDGM